MSQSITIRRRTTRRRRCASRMGSPPVRRLPRSVRRMSTCSPRRSCSARRVRRVGVATSRRLISRYRRASSPGSRASKRLLRSRSSSLGPTGTGRSRSSSSGSSWPGARELAGEIPRCGKAEPARSTRRSSTVRWSGAAGMLRVSSRTGRAVSPSPVPKTAPKTASKARTWVASETSVARAVQYRRRRVSGRTAVRAWAKRAARSGVTGTPTSCRRRPNAPATAGRSSPIVRTVNCAWLTRGPPRAGPGPPCGPRPGPPST